MTSTCVLVVDDDPGVRQVLAAALRAPDFAVYLASNGAEAIIQFSCHHHAIHLVLLDVRMGGMDGPQTLLALQKIDPDVRCCFMSGDVGNYSEVNLLALGAVRVFPKPFGNLRVFVDELKVVAAEDPKRLLPELKPVTA